MWRVAWILALVAACSDGHDDIWNPEADFPPGFETGPQVNQVTATSAVVSWHTFEPAVCGIACGEVRLTDKAPARWHVFRLTGLQPSTEYGYRLVLDGSARDEAYAFRTAPAGDAPFRFAVVGDPGNGSPTQFRIAKHIAAFDPAFVLTTGDNAYENGTREDVIRRYLVPYADLLARVPFFAAIGNHDTYHDNAKSFLEMVELPGDERYYGFRWGSAHFICLDTNIDYGLGSEQHRWLGEELLRAQDAKWRIVYFHHPPYSSSANGSEIPAREALGPIFDEQRIDLVLSGHDHNYERTLPVKGGKAAGGAAPSYTDPEGTIYIVTGGGGKRLYPSGKSWWTARSRSIHHYLQVKIDGGRLTLDARDADDKVFDTLTIDKTFR
jgi:hypothetical protein